VTLRYGTLDWGRVHIARQHGWNAATERDSRLAIAFGYRDTTPLGRVDFESRRRVYTLPIPQRNTPLKLCGRLVAAELAYDPADPMYFGEHREKGVITSFGVRLIP
jgi:hypothetical protein